MEVLEVKETYKILVDWSKYQHEKMQHFNTVNLAIHTLIITAIGSIIIKEIISKKIINNNPWFLLLALTVLGLVLGIIWFLGLRRCRLDVDVFYSLLRNLEKTFEEKQKIFTEGYNFYHCKEVVSEELKKLKCKPKFWGLLKLYQVYVYIALFLYLNILIYALYNLLCIRPS